MNLERARELLIDHSRSKMNGQFSAKTAYENKMTNPLCGDHVQLKFNVDREGHIADFGFMTKACAICSASTSMMSEFVQGKSVRQALDFSEHFENSLLASSLEAWPANLQPLISFEHLKINHARRTCALLPWVALRSALKEIS